MTDYNTTEYKKQITKKMLDNNDRVSFSLVDFKNPNHNNTNIIEQEFDWLKTILRRPKIPFSFEFNESGVIDVPSMDSRYDAKISYRYDCLIVIAPDRIFVFDRKTKALLNSFEFKGVLAAVDDENDAIYTIYLAVDKYGPGHQIEKFRLGEFIRSKNEWKHSSVWCLQSPLIDNPYGLVIYSGKSERYLVVLNSFKKDLYMFHCSSGKMVEDTLFSVVPDGYSIGMIGRNQLIVGTSDLIQIYEIDDCAVEMLKPALKLICSKPIETSEFYAIISDERDHVIMSNAKNNSIMVMRKKDLELVKEFTKPENSDISGLGLDMYTGELYVCYNYHVTTYK